MSFGEKDITFWFHSSNLPPIWPFCKFNCAFPNHIKFSWTSYITLRRNRQSSSYFSADKIIKENIYLHIAAIVGKRIQLCIESIDIYPPPESTMCGQKHSLMIILINNLIYRCCRTEQYESTMVSYNGPWMCVTLTKRIQTASHLLPLHHTLNLTIPFASCVHCCVQINYTLCAAKKRQFSLIRTSLTIEQKGRLKYIVNLFEFGRL